jgi:hypothetical protein
MQNKIVEIDEKLFAVRSSHNNAQRSPKVWVFGFAERENGGTKLSVVENRDAGSLLNLINVNLANQASSNSSNNNQHVSLNTTQEQNER